jgi:uncharacterized membrane protein YccC
MAAQEISLAAHPRAGTSIRRARARTALIAFVVVLLAALHGGVGAQDAILRALVAGVAGNLVAWAIAVALWRQIVLAELRVAREKFLKSGS